MKAPLFASLMCNHIKLLLQYFQNTKFTLRPCFIVIVSVNAIIQAQGQEVFHRISTDDGLSSGSVTSILEDSQGFMWIGTKRGLNRYDGFDFILYKNNTEERASLGSDNVTTMLEDKQHRLWVGTFEGGLNRLDRNTGNFQIFNHDGEQPNSISSNNINVLYQDRDGKLWIGTDDGLNLFPNEGDAFICYRYHPQNAAPGVNDIRSIYESEDGILWLGTFGSGLIAFDKTKGTYANYRESKRTSESLPSDYVNDIEKWNDSSLLVATSGGGLKLFSTQAEEFTDFFSKSEKSYHAIKLIRSLYADENNIWACTDGAGLLKISKSDSSPQRHLKQFRHAAGIKGLTGDAVNVVCKDSHQNIWIGNSWNGLNILDHLQDQDFFYSDFSGEAAAPVLGMLIDRKDCFWIGTDGQGLNYYDPKTGKKLAYQVGDGSCLSDNYINVLHEDAHGTLWIGTFSGGLAAFNKSTEKFTTFRHDANNSASIGHDDIRAILEDNRNNLWVGTWGGGLSRLDGDAKRFKNYQHHDDDPHSISSNNVVAVRRGNDGKFWIATFGGGLNLFDPSTEKFQRIAFGNNNEHPWDKNLLCIHLDKNQNLWIGTWNKGVYKFNIKTGNVTGYTTTEGLIDNTVTSMEEDGAGNIWISTKRGVSRLSVNDGVIKNFSEGIGLERNEFHINSSVKDKQGTIYFGGTAGITAFHPKSNKRHDDPLTIRLTGFQLFNKPVIFSGNEPLNDNSLQKGIVLPFDQNVFTFTYAALKFPFAKQCRYKIKLENFDSDWRDVGTDRAATYTNVPPGRYTFRVMARTHDGKWNDQTTAAVDLQILPPLYKTWWAYSLYVIVFASLLYSFQHYAFVLTGTKNELKVERLKREQDVRLNAFKQIFFVNISHEIRTLLTLIIGPIENITARGETGAEVQRQLWPVKRNANRLLRLMDELIDSARLETGGINLKIVRADLVPFVEEIFLAFSPQATSKNIQYDLLTSCDTLFAWFDKDQLEKVIYNLLSNAFKFTPSGGKILLCLEFLDGKIQIKVSDSGEGISPDDLEKIFQRFYRTTSAINQTAAGFGIGLSIALDIVELHGGTIDVKSIVGEGSEFNVSLPTDNSHWIKQRVPFHHEAEIEDPAPVIETTNKNIGPASGENISRSILIIEDNSALRTYLANCLSAEFKVHNAADGEEGYQKATALMPDLIVSDIMMPVMDGIALCKKLKSDFKTCHIPVVLLTARASWIFEMDGYEVGADDYITKPFNYTLLRARIQNLMEGRNRLREHYAKNLLTLPKEEIIPSRDAKFLTQVVDALERNIDVDLRIHQLTREIGMSHSSFYKKLKALTGRTIPEFIADYRLQKAAQLLEQDQIPIAEVAFRVGYQDRRRFSIAFRKKFGKSPSEFAGDFAQARLNKSP